jgi:hypothetical protein
VRLLACRLTAFLQSFTMALFARALAGSDGASAGSVGALEIVARLTIQHAQAD